MEAFCCLEIGNSSQRNADMRFHNQRINHLLHFWEGAYKTKLARFVPNILGPFHWLVGPNLHAVPSECGGRQKPH